MNYVILTSVIAAASACIGALIPCVFSYLGKCNEYKYDRISKIDEIRRNEYNNFIESLASSPSLTNRV